ncbi:hypothetical protein BTW08_07165 [Salinicola sp. MH3R3-1]|uniref:hypothetical protein n=1 Tax=Salinicola sp. MH3R3-1 TaxID=1928762 RepID=UPI00094EBFBF|nr:hypothetical protein [Salinicola sp. MH3R3-1]OLO08502.1 hypothetical protein BTW08_07165 [Salinicola sp. MH3R3-1]
MEKLKIKSFFSWFLQGTPLGILFWGGAVYFVLLLTLGDDNLVDVINSLAWPVAIGLVLYAIRPELARFLSRLAEVRVYDTYFKLKLEEASYDESSESKCTDDAGFAETGLTDDEGLKSEFVKDDLPDEFSSEDDKARNQKNSEAAIKKHHTDRHGAKYRSRFRLSYPDADGSSTRGTSNSVGAVVESWRRISLLLRMLAKKEGVSYRIDSKIIRGLAEKDLIDPELHKMLLALYQLRNVAVHSESESISYESASKYESYADRVEAKLNKLINNIESPKASSDEG